MIFLSSAGYQENQSPVEVQTSDLSVADPSLCNNDSAAPLVAASSADTVARAEEPH